jgi:hypothetical protein
MIYTYSFSSVDDTGGVSYTASGCNQVFKTQLKFDNKKNIALCVVTHHGSPWIHGLPCVSRGSLQHAGCDGER